MTMLFPVLLPALLALAAGSTVQKPSARAAAKPVTTAKASPTRKAGAAQLKLQKQADLVVGCVGQRTLPRKITPKQRALLFQVVRELRVGPSAQVQGKWKQFVRQMQTGGVPMDINSLIQWVLRESYLETNKDLQFYADKVRHFNEQKKAIRDHVSDMRKKYAELRGKKKPATVRTVKLRPYRKGARATISGPSKVVNNESEWEDYIKQLEGELSSVGEDSQLANVDLQNILQKQQQTLQMMKNISEMLHDTAMAVIRKIGG